MTINFCALCNDPCTGANAGIGNNNMQETWRTLVAQALCGLASAVAAVTDIVSGSLAFGSVSVAYATLITNTDPIQYLDVVNSLNVPIWVSFDASTDTFYLAAGTARTFNLKELGISATGNVSVRSTSAPGSGTVAGSIGVNA